MNGGDYDQAVRITTFDWLANQTVAFDDVLPGELLQKGFVFQGERVPLMPPQGIFKPRIMDLPLSITTTSNLDKPYPDQVFTVLIRGSDRGKFEKPPETLYSGKKICVTGTIQGYQGRPEIIVKEPSQIEIK
jgi:hypothetical protein